MRNDLKADRSVADRASRLRFIIGTLLWLTVVLDILGIGFFGWIVICLDDTASPYLNNVPAFAAFAAGPVIVAAISSAGSSMFVSKQRYRLALWSLAGPLIVLSGILAYLLVQFFLL